MFFRLNFFQNSCSVEKDVRLVVKNGVVIDPSQEVHEEQDIAIYRGKLLMHGRV